MAQCFVLFICRAYIENETTSVDIKLTNSQYVASAIKGAEAANTSRALLTFGGGHLEAKRKVTSPKVAGSLCSTIANATTSFRSSLSDIPVVPTATPAKQFGITLVVLIRID